MEKCLIEEVKRLAELERVATPGNWQLEESVVNENQAGIFYGNDISKEFILRYMHDAWGLREKDLNLIIEMRNAAPKLLDVLSHFEPNDAYLLDALICMIDRDHMHEFAPHRAALVRMCHAASLMEAQHEI